MIAAPGDVCYDRSIGQVDNTYGVVEVIASSKEREPSNTQYSDMIRLWYPPKKATKKKLTQV